jgi:hypothetical protein
VNSKEDRLYTVAEAARDYFQGKVSGRQVNRLFNRGLIRGFRAGSTILLYESGLDEYRRSRENQPPAPPEPARPKRAGRTRRAEEGYEFFPFKGKPSPAPSR